MLGWYINISASCDSIRVHGNMLILRCITRMADVVIVQNRFPRTLDEPSRLVAAGPETRPAASSRRWTRRASRRCGRAPRRSQTRSAARPLQPRWHRKPSRRRVFVDHRHHLLGLGQSCSFDLQMAGFHVRVMRVQDVDCTVRYTGIYQLQQHHPLSHNTTGVPALPTLRRCDGCSCDFMTPHLATILMPTLNLCCAQAGTSAALAAQHEAVAASQAGLARQAAELRRPPEQSGAVRRTLNRAQQVFADYGTAG